MKEDALINIFGETIHVDFLENAAEKIPNEATSFAKWLIEECEPNKEFSFANYWEKLPIVYDKMVRLLCASLDANIVKFTNDPVRIVFAVTPQFPKAWLLIYKSTLPRRCRMRLHPSA